MLLEWSRYVSVVRILNFEFTQHLFPQWQPRKPLRQTVGSNRAILLSWTKTDFYLSRTEVRIFAPPRRFVHNLWSSHSFQWKTSSLGAEKTSYESCLSHLFSKHCNHFYCNSALRWSRERAICRSPIIRRRRRERSRQTTGRACRSRRRNQALFQRNRQWRERLSSGKTTVSNLSLP